MEENKREIVGTCKTHPCLSSCVVHIVLFILLTTLSCVHASNVLNNLSSAGFHPSKVLSSSSLSQRDSSTSLSSSETSQSSLSSSSSKREGATRDPLREDEVMYHMHRNGRTKGDYRKASTSFMVELFNNLQNGDQLLPTGSRSEAVTDTIRSFSGQNSARNKKGRRLIRFSVPYLPWHERLRSAEIRFLRKASIKGKSRRFKIRVDVRRDRKIIQKFILRERSVAQNEYDVFDITRILRPWVNGYHGNISLHVKVSRKLESHTQVALQDTSLRSTSLIVLYLEDRQFLKNMYTSYTADDANRKNEIPGARSSSPINNTKRYRRSLPFSDSVFSDILSSSLDSLNSNEHIQKRVKRDNKQLKRDNKQRKRRNRKNRKWYRGGRRENCQMYDFDVDFKSIGWGQWIIHPKRFNSRFCFGVCPSPIDSKFQPTNHAMLQTLMKMKKPNIAPSPCCVPTSLKSVSMLYFEYDEIVVRHHDDMIASECGCR